MNHVDVEKKASARLEQMGMRTVRGWSENKNRAMSVRIGTKLFSQSIH